MTDAEPTGRATAGALLRAARERQGLHIAALAAAIKVTPRKLDALERDAYDELPDATFTRALAKTVCRTLKIDPAPVLALLPQNESMLDHVGGSLNTPFRERASRDEPAGLAAAAVRPMVWAAGLLLVAAAAVYLLPPGWLQWPPGGTGAPAAVAETPASAPAGALVEAAPPAASAVVMVEAPVASAPAAAAVVPAAAVPAAAGTAPPLAATPAAAASAAAPLLQLKTVTGPSWVEVRDAQGRVLLSRTMQAGEAAGVEGAPPFRLTVGNALVTEVAYRGKAVDMTPHTKGIVARFELQ